MLTRREILLSQCPVPEICLFRGRSTSPHFSRPVRNAHGVPSFVGASLAAKDFAPAGCCLSSLRPVTFSQTYRICEKVRLDSFPLEMKKLINSPENVVLESIAGLGAALAKSQLPRFAGLRDSERISDP
jgi:hypothetical protein